MALFRTIRLCIVVSFLHWLSLAQSTNSNIGSLIIRKYLRSIDWVLVQNVDMNYYCTWLLYIVCSNLTLNYLSLPCRFCSNAYRTSSYSKMSFVPLNLFHQLSHPSNFYFLFIMFLQLIPELSPTNWYTTFVPLFCIFVIECNQRWSLWL